MSFDGTSMKLTDASSYNNVYGILLERVDSDIERGACGTIARAKSFKATELVMAPEPTCEDGADQLRKNGIYLEGMANFVPSAPAGQQTESAGNPS
jgi:hypothetical protein